MSIHWHSTLIPVDAHFQPTPEQVATFLERCEGAGAFGAKVERIVLDFDHPREGTELPVRHVPAMAHEVATLVRGLRHWSAQCSAERAGRNPPVRGMVISADGEWRPAKNDFVAVRCEGHGQLVSMCDLHEESGDSRTAVFFGEPSSPRQRLGLFSNPHTSRVISVPGAGASSFHIEFWFGSLVFPPRSMTKLHLVALEYIVAARSAFGVDFVEGCHWG